MHCRHSRALSALPLCPCAVASLPVCSPLGGGLASLCGHCLLGYLRTRSTLCHIGPGLACPSLPPRHCRLRRAALVSLTSLSTAQNCAQSAQCVLMSLVPGTMNANVLQACVVAGHLFWSVHLKYLCLWTQSLTWCCQWQLPRPRLGVGATLGISSWPSLCTFVRALWHPTSHLAYLVPRLGYTV